MKVLFRLTEEDLQSIMDASKPTPVMYLSGGVPMGGSPQENANRAWQTIAARHGFIWDTAEPANTGDQHDLLAERIKPVEPIVQASDDVTTKGQS